MYRKAPKFSGHNFFNTDQHCKIQTKRLFHGVISSNYANGIAHSEDPDQIAPLRVFTVYSNCLSENFGSLRYF